MENKNLNLSNLLNQENESAQNPKKMTQMAFGINSETEIL